MKKVLFGTAGSPEAFYQEGGKHSHQMPTWLSKNNLDAFEYSAGRGVRLGQIAAEAIAKTATQHNIALSIHAPYFINLATVEREKTANNERYLLSSIDAAEHMGADRVVFHVGSQVKLERTLAFKYVQNSLHDFMDKLTVMGKKVLLAPETMGKKSQIGTLAEIVELCKISPMLIPTIDFGHLHAAQNGGYDCVDDYLRTFEYIAQHLGEDILYNFQIHFSKIEFTKAGEKCHHRFIDDFGPPFEPMVEALHRTGYTPRIICESAGTQDVDALAMKLYYQKLNS